VATDSHYRPHDNIRVCDICGHRFHFSDLRPIGELRWACKDDSPGLTAMQISRWNARARPLKVKPFKWAKGITQTPTYQIPEAAVFNSVATTAFVAGSAGPGIAWAAIYLGQTLQQGLRPAGWLTLAAVQLRNICDILLTGQFGDPTGPAVTATDPRYGGISNGTICSTQTTIPSGVAFILAYQTLGDAKYGVAADRCATFLRHVQCCDLLVSGYTTYPSGGGPYHIGGFASSVSSSTGVPGTSYLLADIIGLWFLTMLAAVRGQSAVYGDAASSASYSAPTAAPLSTMIAELGAFASVGAKDSSVNGNFVTGLSTTMPQATYFAAANGVGGAAAWTFTSTISSDSIAQAVLGVFQAFGLNAQVTSIMNWLAAFTPNPANATPVQPDSKTQLGITGTYDPTLCPATSLQASAPFTESTGTTYAWGSLGLLSPVLAAMSPGLRTSKDTLSAPVRTSLTDYKFVYMGVNGISGLSLQPNLGTTSIVNTAKTALVYRQPPGYYPRVALF
jgi:hypothetical protein